MQDTPLGKSTRYPLEYDPGVLCAVSRNPAREALGLGTQLPFMGMDIWNAWELTWLAKTGKPIVATAVITVPAESPNIVESKSLKLYLNSFAMTRYAAKSELEGIIARDLSDIIESKVTVDIKPETDPKMYRIVDLPGRSIDDLDINIEASGVDASLLKTTEGETEETLHSHLLRSNCPVTNQPDMGSVMVRYKGTNIDRESLLKYIVSYRQHNDFHEACVERIFVDIKTRCATEKLTVYARFNRRGGIDINPFRSDFETSAENLRLWRQ
ncbi:MAG: NADPH-dependent 7-cyano-7-deazaguanine reductase QueF [Woeseiaceae bacterium]|nr:NADPH-dependent 7-cyano-7-deazaguanine reductase QueF [Woeseiaceae bacterium]